MHKSETWEHMLTGCSFLGRSPSTRHENNYGTFILFTVKKLPYFGFWHSIRWMICHANIGNRGENMHISSCPQACQKIRHHPHQNEGIHERRCDIWHITVCMVWYPLNLPRAHRRTDYSFNCPWKRGKMIHHDGHSSILEIWNPNTPFTRCSTAWKSDLLQAGFWWNEGEPDSTAARRYDARQKTNLQKDIK